MTQTVEQQYQVVADVLRISAPRGWEKAWVVTTFGEASGESSFDYIDGAGQENWFVPAVEAQLEVYKAFKEVRQVMQQTSGKPACSSIRFELEKNGRFHIDFGYE